MGCHPLKTYSFNSIPSIRGWMSDLLTAHIVQQWPYFALNHRPVPSLPPLPPVSAGSSQGWVITRASAPAPMIRPLIICLSNYPDWAQTWPLVWATLLTVMTLCTKGVVGWGLLSCLSPGTRVHWNLCRWGFISVGNVFIFTWSSNMTQPRWVSRVPRDDPFIICVLPRESGLLSPHAFIIFSPNWGLTALAALLGLQLYI